MLRLYLLGRLELAPTEREDQSAVLAQPKRLAFLAYLAVGAGTYQRRDTLLALFWPELDEFAARRALRNTLYQLRLSLGEAVFVARGDDEIMVDREALWCDAAALRDAVAAGRYEEAGELYRGELLEGFHISNVGEGFESWLARERAQALALALRALDAQVVCYQKEGNGAAAAQCAVKATALAPFDELWLRRAALALDAVGDRSGALRLIDAFARRMETELEARPSDETRRLIDQLRSHETPIAAARPIPVATAAPVAPATPAAPVTPSINVATTNPIEIAPPSAVASKKPTYWRMAAAVALATVIGLGALATRRPWRDPSRDTPHAPDRVLVTQFENRTGDSTLDRLGDMEVDWLARGLVGTRFVDVVNPRALAARGRTHTGQPVDPGQLAHRIGAALVITGSYYRSGDSLLFVAAIVDADGHVLRTVGPIPATLSRPVDGVESTRARVTAALASIVDPRSRHAWNMHAAPPTFEAYEPYVAGWDAFWLGRFVKAESLFALAASRDTTFDAANVAVATASANLLRCGVVDSVARSLARRGRALDELDGLTMRIAVARCEGHNDEMFRLTVQRERAMSATSPSQLSTANAALWANRPADAVAILERLNPAVDMDWTPRPDHLEYWASLSEGDHMMAQHVAELAALDRSGVAGLGRALYIGRALAALGRSTDALQALDSAFRLTGEPDLTSGAAVFTDGRPEYTGSAAWVGLWIARELHVHGDSAGGRAAAARTLAWLETLPRGDRESPEMRLFEAELLEQVGAIHDATRVMQGLVAADSSNIDYRGLLAGLAVANGDSALAERLDAWLAAVPPKRALWGVAFYRARVASLRGRAADAVGLVQESLARGAWPYWVHQDPALHRLAARPDYVALTTPRP